VRFIIHPFNRIGTQQRTGLKQRDQIVQKSGHFPRIKQDRLDHHGRRAIGRQGNVGFDQALHFISHHDALPGGRSIGVECKRQLHG
jgi:hypothetical protein